MKKITLLILLAIPFIGFSQNLITNSTFVDASGWTEKSVGSGTTHIADTTYPLNTQTNDTSGCYSLVGNATYTPAIEFRVQSSELNGNYYLAGAWVKGAKDAKVRLRIRNPSAWANGDIYTIQAADTWEHIEQAFKIDPAQRVDLRVNVIETASAVKIDNVSFEKVDVKESYLFETNGDFEGVTTISVDSKSVTGGELVIDGKDNSFSKILLDPTKFIFGENSYIHIRLRNDSPNNTLRIQNGANQYLTEITSIDESQTLGNYSNYTLDLSDNGGLKWDETGYNNGGIYILIKDSDRLTNPNRTSDGILYFDYIIFNNSPTLTHTWTGATSNDWSDATNWENGFAPGSTPVADINIPVGNPVIDSDFTIPSPYNINVFGSLTIDPSITLTVDSGASLTMLSGASLTNNGTITNNGTVTFKSDVNGSAFIGNGTGTFTGDYTIERYIPAKRAFRLLSSPVTTSNFIANNWQQGTDITGSTDGSNGFDITPSGNPSMFTFNNVDQTWNAIANTDATNLIAGTPYRIMIRGDKTINLNDNAATPTVTTLIATGELTAENTAPSALVLNKSALGDSFIANPFQAPVDMNAILSNNTTNININPTYYWIWDPNVNERGGFVAIDVTNGGTQLEDNVTAPTSTFATKNLQAGQAAFVQTLAAGAASLTFDQASKNTTVAETATFKSSSTKSSLSQLRLSLYESSALADNKSIADGLMILFDDSFSNTVDAFDASKFTNLDENFAISNGGKLLSIERRATPIASDEIPLNITTYRNSNYTIVAQGTAMQGETAFLFDAYTNIHTEIPQNGTVNYTYSVDANIPTSIGEDRFSIVFSANIALAVPDLEIQKIHLYPNPVNNGIFHLYVPQDIQDLELTVYNVLGAKLYYRTGFKSGSEAIIDTNFAREHGLYFVKLSSKGNSITKKLIIN